MHFLSLVVIGSAEVDAAVEEVMAPYSEELDESAASFWDWYQIGGRWTGVYSGYDPETDPRNADPVFGGVTWPTQYVRHDGDILTPAQVMAAIEDGKQTPYTMITPEWVGHCEVWDNQAATFVPTPNWDGMIKEKLRNLSAFGDRFRLVVVDYHS